MVIMMVAATAVATVGMMVDMMVRTIVVSAAVAIFVPAVDTK